MNIYIPEAPVLREILDSTLSTIAHELRETLMSDVREFDGDYKRIIAEVERCRQRGRVTHFVGVGKSHYVALNLAYIFMNLGFQGHCCELTGANCENLTSIKRDDMVFLISNSGRACELLNLLDSIKKKDV